MTLLEMEPADALSASFCRLCGSPTEAVFTLSVRDRFQGQYGRCSLCGSLQVENSRDWIEEAYQGTLADEDTGAAQRALYNQMVVSWLYRILSLSRSALLLDFGGGEGLLVRLLRDVGVNARFDDKYGGGSFAAAFRYDQQEKPQIVTSFEVWEHFVDPWTSIKAIFELKPRYLFVSTVLYKGEGPDWWYLVPQSGQHVFFYAQTAMDLLAAHFGYHAYSFKGAYTLFAQRPLKRWQCWAVNLVLTHKLRKILLAGIVFYSGRCLDNPHSRMAVK